MKNNDWLDKICLPDGENGDFILDDDFFIPEFPNPDDSDKIKKKKYDDFIKKLNGDNI
jgi:hypothetical protein